jgi:CubicO group peptidase (beta-lactamase class C family)
MTGGRIPPGSPHLTDRDEVVYNLVMTRADAFRHVLATAVDTGQLAGAAALIARDGAIDAVTAGRRDLRSGLPVERDTIFRIASLSKPITTVAALSMIDEGRLSLDEPITRCAPEFAHMRVLREPEGPLDQCDDAIRPITFRDLLTHRAGLTYGDFHRGPIGRAYAETLGPQIDNPLTTDEWIARLASLPLIDQPGAGFHYGHSTDLLGMLLSRLESAPLSAVMDRRIFTPLAMRDTGFTVPSARRDRRAGLCGFDQEGRLTALTAAPGGHAIDERPETMTFEAGGQGLWSTLDDYFVFARMLIGKNGHAVLREETLAMMRSNQLTEDQRSGARLLNRPIFAGGHGYGMGVAVVMDPATADPLRCRGGVGTIGWPGAYGGWWQADPNDQSVFVFLTHNMVELQQMARGIGLEIWDAIGRFHSIATS